MRLLSLTTDVIFKDIWLNLFKVKNKEEFKMIAEKSEIFKEATDYLENLSSDKENIALEEQRWRSLMFYNFSMGGSKEEGRNEGIEIGRKEGREEGREEGISKLIKYIKEGKSLEEAERLAKLNQ